MPPDWEVGCVRSESFDRDPLCNTRRQRIRILRSSAPCVGGGCLAGRRSLAHVFAGRCRGRRTTDGTGGVWNQECGGRGELGWGDDQEQTRAAGGSRGGELLQGGGAAGQVPPLRTFQPGPTLETTLGQFRANGTSQKWTRPGMPPDSGGMLRGCPLLGGSIRPNFYSRVGPAGQGRIDSFSRHHLASTIRESPLLTTYWSEST